MFRLQKVLKNISQKIVGGISTLNTHSSDIATINGKLNDYIVEQGTSGIWTYRKWASGVAECWGSATKGRDDFPGTWGGLYESHAYSEAFPSGLFSSISSTIINPASIDGNTCGIERAGLSSISNIGTFYFLRPTKYTVGNLYAYYYAKGRWK